MSAGMQDRCRAGREIPRQAHPLSLAAHIVASSPTPELVMKDGLKQIVGKQVAAVVVASSPDAPAQQVFLVFPDGSSFEFHGREFTCNAGLDPAERIESYVESRGGRITRVYGDVRVTAPAPATVAGGPPDGDSLEGRLFRDLAAWQEAKGVIAKARGPG
jgi:hypothetical protein